MPATPSAITRRLSAATLFAVTVALGGGASQGADADVGRIEVPAVASESGLPPREMRLRAIVARALDDVIATWKRLVATDALEVGNANVRFVDHLAPSNCFGLYTGDGPAYCGGNATVFVGVDAANTLMAKFGPERRPASRSIGHEISHHIQNIFSRFQATANGSQVPALEPGRESSVASSSRPIAWRVSG